VLALQGTNLTSGITVTFDGVPGTVYHPPGSGSRAIVVAPPRPAGAVTITVTNALAESVSQSSLLTYVDLPAIGAATPVVRGSLTAAGAQAPDVGVTTGSFTPRLSADGNLVAFSSDSDLGFGTRIKLYAKNLGTGALALINACGDCSITSISGDGSRVAFLWFGVGSGRTVHYADAPFGGAQTRIDTRPDGVAANARSTAAVLSADGRFAAFGSEATNLDDSTADTVGTNDLFVKDLQTLAIERWTTGRAISSVAISGNGRFLAFATTSQLLPADTNAVSDVYLIDRTEGPDSLRLLTAGADGASTSPQLSADGSVVAFTSSATNLVAGDTNNASDVFVMDVASAAVSRVSVSSSDTQATSSSSAPAVSADGRFVAFTSAASNLVTGDVPNTTNVFVHDRSSGVTFLADADVNGVIADGNASGPSISADGRFVSFATSASNLVAGDTNALLDVYRKEIPESWRTLALMDTTIQRGQTGTQVVRLTGSGTENAAGFSVTFDPALVTLSSVALGAGAGTATLVTNETQKASGRVGVLVGLPAGQTWSAGARDLVTLTFAASAGTTAATVTTAFGDTPVVREVASTAGEALATIFEAGTLTLDPPPTSVAPTITTPPGSRTITAGQTTTFTVLATGTPAPSYQWQVSTDGGTTFANLNNGAPYSGVTTATLTVTAAPITLHDARYRVRVSNTAGTVTSTAATLTVREPLPVTQVTVVPTGIVAGAAGAVTVRMVGKGTENALGATVVFDPAVLTVTSTVLAAGGTGATLVVNDTQASSGRIGLLLGLPAGQVWAAGVRDLVSLTVTTASGASVVSPVIFADAPVVREVSDATGTALPATFSAGAVTVSSRRLTLVDTTIQRGQTGTQVVRLTGSGTENAAGFSVTFDPALVTLSSVALGAGAGTATLVTNETEKASGRVGVLIGLPAGQTWSAGARDLVTLTFAASAGTTAATVTTAFGDTPVVREVASAAGEALATIFEAGTLTLDPPPTSVAPTITTPPGSRTVTAGQNATFTVLATGTPAPSYRWQVSTDGGTSFTNLTDVAPYSGTTSATLTITAASASLNGAHYRVLATNVVDTATSAAATLTVQTAPSITTPPANRTINAGQTTTFVVVAEGNPAPTYQWQVSTNGGTSFTNLTDVAPYSGTTSATLTITAASASLNGAQYRVVATNVVDAATSAAATLTVQTAPSVTTPPANRTINAGQTTTFVVVAEGNPAPTYQWQVSTNGGTSFTNLADVSPYSGLATATLTVTEAPTSLNGARYRAVATNAVASATSDAAVLTVRGNATASPSSLRFAAVRRGTSLTFTASQQVTVTYAGAGSSWTATSTVPWLAVVPGGGSGAGTFEVVVNGDAIPAEGASHSGAVTVSTPLAPSTTVTIPVVLTVSLVTLPPVGQVDTPSQDSTGLQGAIGVTGWVLDDIGVASVKIYRNCLDFDNPASCQMVLADTPQAANVVYIGDAAFLAGARTDVEGGFPEYPAANRAGWGYLLLTSMLPHVSNRAGFGGQGPLTLYAVATDVDGHTILLGRSAVATDPSHSTPTRITMDNDGIGKPFGAIDTPGQGATVSGILANFGWALTPDRNRTTGDPDDIQIPIDGSTMTVFLDGAPIAQVTYNQCRGSVGNPPPVGVFCDDDVANIFGQVTPQPVLTVRGANPTLFRNLDAGRAAIGSFAIDTRTLSNGRHTIAWSVTDSAGRTEGIGSRFFYVLNGTTDAPVTWSVSPSVAGDSLGRGAAMVTDARLADVPPGTIWVRTGFDLRTPWRTLSTTESAPPEIALDQLGRLELWLGTAVSEAWLVGPDEQRWPLPVGLQITGAQVTWAPPAGYLGAYTVALVRDGQRVDVRVVVR
jgi:predicted secreted protein